VRFRALLGLALLALGGCGSCGKEAPPIEDAAVAGVEAPVPAPEGLVADLVVPTPNATWGRVQRGVGGALGILPATLGGVVCAFSGLDPTLGPEIDGVAPVTGVVTAGEGRAFGWALAMKLVEPRRAKDLLLDGEGARYVAKAAGTMTQVVPKVGSLPIAVALANGGYLVLARDEADLASLGPYAYRTLPTRPVPETGGLVADLREGAFKGWLTARAKSSWEQTRGELLRLDDAEREKHGGRAPDFGDPRAILASIDDVVKERLAQMADLESGRVVVDADNTQIHVDATLKPAGGAASAAVASMRPGDASPLLSAHDGLVAVLVRDDAAGRAQTTTSVEAAVTKALGARIAEPEAKRLHAALEGWTKARGDWLVAGLVGFEGAYVLTPAASGEPVDRALKDAVELAKAPPLKDALRVRDVKWNGPREAVLTYGEKKTATLKWATEGGRAKVTLAAGPLETKTIADDPSIATAVTALGSGVTFAAVVQPLKLDPARAAVGAAPVVIGYGTKDGRIWVHADVADPLLREVAKGRMGF
jgi:hypothetical protein